MRSQFCRAYFEHGRRFSQNSSVVLFSKYVLGAGAHILVVKSQYQFVNLCERKSDKYTELLSETPELSYSFIKTHTRS